MLEEKLSLEGKGVVITGGGTGLGREMTLAMARAGADIVIAARRVGPIEEVAEEVRALGRKGVAISTDVTDTAQVNRLMESSIAELGKVDVLLNNAGIVRGQGAIPIWEISDDDWRIGIEVNMSSAFYCARAIAKHMVERGQGQDHQPVVRFRLSRRTRQLHVLCGQGRDRTVDTRACHEPWDGTASPARASCLDSFRLKARTSRG